MSETRQDRTKVTIFLERFRQNVKMAMAVECSASARSLDCFKRIEYSCMPIFNKHTVHVGVMLLRTAYRIYPRSHDISHSGDCDIAYRLKLYYGLSHDGQGRRDYLQTRVHIPPEDRYSLALLSSWQYGWQIVHKEELFDLPAHRRTSRIQESFFARNGVPKLHHDHPEIPTLIKETTH